MTEITEELQQKIKDRTTELQMEYDMALAEKEFFEHEISILKARLFEVNKTIDKCIEREKDYGIKIL